jgi:pimeloyl-ACP methyl ester carboxylesterase
LIVEVHEQDGVHIHQITRGRGKPLLLIHELGSSWRAWRPVLDDLAAERSVIAIDLPGHGATPAEQDSGTFAGLVGSVERYLVANDLVGIDVAGSSMGARIVLELARRGRSATSLRSTIAAISRCGTCRTKRRRLSCKRRGKGAGGSQGSTESE